MRGPAFGLSASLPYCAFLCPRVRILPKRRVRQRLCHVYTCVTCLSLWMSLVQFGYLWFSLSLAESARHDNVSISAGKALRTVMTLRHFQYRPYSQEFSISFKKFPLFDRAPHQAGTLPRQTRAAMLKRRCCYETRCGKFYMRDHYQSDRGRI